MDKYVHMHVCVGFHKCMVKATSPNTVPDAFRKVLTVSKVP